MMVEENSRDESEDGPGTQEDEEQQTIDNNEDGIVIRPRKRATKPLPHLSSSPHHPPPNQLTRDLPPMLMNREPLPIQPPLDNSRPPLDSFPPPPHPPTVID